MLRRITLAGTLAAGLLAASAAVAPVFADRWPSPCEVCTERIWPGPNPPINVTSGVFPFTFQTTNACAPQDGLITLTGTETSLVKTLTGTYPGFFPPLHQIQESVVFALTGTSATGVPYTYNAKLSGIVLEQPTFEFHSLLISQGSGANERGDQTGIPPETFTCVGKTTT